MSRDSGWQPIETAPKDGQDILLATSLRVTVASWGKCRPQHNGYVANDGRNCWRSDGQEKMVGGKAIAWMLLPDPPCQPRKERE
jgi:hypothetical protein